MKFTTHVKIKQYTTDILSIPCHCGCGHKDELDLDALGLIEEVDAPVEFILPDRLLTRGENGRATGSIETANLLREMSD